VSAKEKKMSKERSEKEAAELELGLCNKDVQIISFTTTLLGSNPVSLLS
jgi:hypothetical protein